MSKKIRYYGLWSAHLRRWVTTKKWRINTLSWSYFIPDLLAIGNKIPLWKNKKKLEQEFCEGVYADAFSWEAREFTGLDAMKERMKTCLRK